MNYQKIRKNRKQFLSLTSMSIEKFDKLLPAFSIEWNYFITNFALDGLPRVRPFVASKDDFLPTSEDKLFFILCYQKNASLQEFFAAAFDTKQSICNKWVHLLSPILQKSLAKYTPKNDLLEVEFLGNETYLIDATERAIQRNTYNQKEFYSGKKKRHTLKNMALCNTLGVLLYLSSTVSGKIHDKKMVENVAFKPVKFTLYADLAFIGWSPTPLVKVITPFKKPKNTKTQKRTLTTEQKLFNTEHSQIRVPIEHLFSNLKVMRILKDTLRNYKNGFSDLIIQTAGALYNFRKGFLVNKYN